jgi:acyl-CoA thioester hydrolase
LTLKTLIASELLVAILRFHSRSITHIKIGPAQICYMMAMVAAPSHAFNVCIDPRDIDFMGHVNNASYLKWVQDAVLSHWHRVAPQDAASAHQWVVLKHEITYRRPAFLSDNIIATVLLERVQGASAFYDTVIRRGEDVLAEVKSRWCCLDAATLRPTRLDDAVVRRFLPEPNPVDACLE